MTTTVPTGAICMAAFTCHLPGTQPADDGTWTCTGHAERGFSVDVREVPWHKLTDVEAHVLMEYDGLSRQAAFWLHDPNPPEDTFTERRQAFVDTVLAAQWDAVEAMGAA